MMMSLHFSCLAPWTPVLLSFFFIQVPYYQAITSHVLCLALKMLLVVCANLQYRWVPEGVLNRTLHGALISVLLHKIVVFAILLDVVYTFSYFRNCVMCVTYNHFSRSWNISNESIYDGMTKYDVNACTCICMCIICESRMCVHAYILVCCGYVTSETGQSTFCVLMSLIFCWCTEKKRQ